MAVADLFRFPRYWWGIPGDDLLAPTYSILDLLDASLLDTRVGGLLWALLHRRASLLVVGGRSRGTGKTTVLTALTGFLPAGTHLVFLRGEREDFSFVDGSMPERSYLLAGEFSDHTPGYVWGENAARTWRLTPAGFRFAGTMHADGVEDLLHQVTAPPVSLQPAEVAKALQLSLFLGTEREGNSVRRRITGVQWYQPAERGPGGLGAKSLVAWSAVDDHWTLFSSPNTWDDLARWSETDAESLRAETEERARFLDHLLLGPDRTFDAVRRALLAFRG